MADDENGKLGDCSCPSCDCLSYTSCQVHIFQQLLSSFIDMVIFVKHRWRWCIRHILFLVLKAFNNLPDTLGSPGHQIYLYYD